MIVTPRTHKAITSLALSIIEILNISLLSTHWCSKSSKNPWK